MNAKTHLKSIAIFAMNNLSLIVWVVLVLIPLTASTVGFVIDSGGLLADGIALTVAGVFSAVALTLAAGADIAHMVVARRRRKAALSSLSVGRDKLNVSAMYCLATALKEQFEKSGAENFLTVVLEPIEKGDTYEFIMQRVDGETPAQKARRLGDELREAKDRIAELEYKAALYDEACAMVQVLGHSNVTNALTALKALITKLDRLVEDTRHYANEWADAATNAPTYIKNVRDGVRTFEEVLAMSARDIAHAQGTKPKELESWLCQRRPGLLAGGDRRSQAVEALLTDGERFQWLLDDHDDKDAREQKRAICEHICVKTISAVRADIDANLRREAPRVQPSSDTVLTGCCERCEGRGVEFDPYGESACPSCGGSGKVPAVDGSAQ